MSAELQRPENRPYLSVIIILSILTFISFIVAAMVWGNADKGDANEDQWNDSMMTAVSIIDLFVFGIIAIFFLWKVGWNTKQMDTVNEPMSQTIGTVAWVLVITCIRIIITLASDS